MQICCFSETYPSSKKGPYSKTVIVFWLEKEKEKKSRQKEHGETIILYNEKVVCCLLHIEESVGCPIDSSWKSDCSRSGVIFQKFYDLSMNEIYKKCIVSCSVCLHKTCGQFWPCRRKKTDLRYSSHPPPLLLSN